MERISEAYKNEPTASSGMAKEGMRGDPALSARPIVEGRRFPNEKEIKDVIKNAYGGSDDPMDTFMGTGAFLIDGNGDFITGFGFHSELVDYLADYGYIDWGDVSDDVYNDVFARLGYVRGNSSSDSRMCYLSLTYERPSARQMGSIGEWIEALASKTGLMGTFDLSDPTNRHFVTMPTLDPKRVVNAISQYYVTGKLPRQEFLRESTKVYGGIRMTESPYEMADILRNSKKGLRIIYDPRKDWYIYNDESERVHVDMMRYAIEEAGLYPGLRYYEADGYMWSGEPDSPICLWFQPKGSERNEMVGIDQYTEELVYPFGHLAGRCEYLDFPLTEGKIPLVGKLGKPIAHYVLDDYKVKRIEESLLVEKTRQQLLDKSRNGAAYAPNNRAKGKNRYERRKYSKVAATIKDYNSIDMNAFFKGDYLEFGVPVHGETDDYVVTVTFERILPRLQHEVKSDRNMLSEKAVLRALLGSFNTGDVYVSCTCLHPDTRIKLLDGTNPTVAEMRERFDKGERLYVYSADEKGDFKPGEVERVWVAKTARDFVKVTLDNGQEILTTPEHPYMLMDGSYAEAEGLAAGMPLMHVDGAERKVANVERVTLEDTPVYDIHVKDWHNFALDAGVMVHNCKDFQFAGFNYLAVKQDYNSNPIFGKAMQPPTIRNPNDDKGAACKHILRVLSDVSWMMNVARVIYNYIKVSRELMQRNYAEIIFPKVYGRSYKGVVQTSLMDKDDMWGDALLQSDKRELDAVIAAAKQGRDVRGRFSQGNPYAFKKRDAQAGPTLSKGGQEDADDSRQPGDMHA